MDIWLKILLWVLPVFFAITVHEIAHGWVASYFGDQTARLKGRLSLNPFRHIDCVGSLLVPSILLTFSGMVFGWAKPVPVNIACLNDPKRHMGMVAVAGPAANFVMSMCWAFIMKFGLWISLSLPLVGSVLIYMGAAGILINTALMMLNLFPLPPLDGGRMLAALLPARQASWLLKLERWGLLILVLLLLSGAASEILWPMMVLGMALSTHLAMIPVGVFNQALYTLLN